MLKHVERPRGVSGPTLTLSPGDAVGAFHGLLARQRRLIAAVVSLSVGLAGLYLLTTPPSFTAQTALIINPRMVLPLFGQQATSDEIPPDPAAVQSQVEIIKSEKISLAVLQKLNLVKDAEFVGVGDGLLGMAIGAVADWLSPIRSDSELLKRAAKRFSDRLDVQRVGLSDVIEINFRALSPTRAADIANAVANAYVADQIEAKSAEASQAAFWLQKRVQELEEDASRAERAVVDFKARRSQLDNESQAAVRGLESTAKTRRDLVDRFIQRYTESVQQQSFPISEARVITVATPPIKKSHPKGMLILAGSSLVGLLMGLGLAKLRDSLDRGFRTTRQVKSSLHTECIGMMPTVATSARRFFRKNSSTNPDKKTFTCRLLPACYATDFPFSHFAEFVRSIKLATCGSRGVIGITSTLPNEGKSTVATALAQSLALAGSSVVLIDCDLRNPSISRSLTPNARVGVFEVLTGTVALQDAIWKETKTALSFLPQTLRTRMACTSEILSSDAMRKMFDQLRGSFSYVVADLPPLTPLIDVRAAAALIDCYVYVIEWARTREDIVEQSLDRATEVRERLAGVVLNKVDFTTIGRYDGHGADYYATRSYRRYGLT